MKKILIAFIMCSISTISYADEIFDTTNMSPDEIIHLAEDIGGKQGQCVLMQTLEYLDYDQNVKIVIPDESHRIDFYYDGELRSACSRFSEDYFEIGELVNSIDYDKIEGYE